MPKKDLFTKLLAIAGTLLAWFPILAPLLLALVFLIASGKFRLDYLMPAEFFPVALIGGGLLWWAAIRARTRQKLIGWSLILAILSLGGGQALADITGIASGEAQPTAWMLTLIFSSLGIYTFFLVIIAVAGLRLMLQLFKPDLPALASG